METNHNPQGFFDEIGETIRLVVVFILGKIEKIFNVATAGWKKYATMMLVLFACIIVEWIDSSIDMMVVLAIMCVFGVGLLLIAKRKIAAGLAIILISVVAVSGLFIPTARAYAFSTVKHWSNSFFQKHKQGESMKEDLIANYETVPEDVQNRFNEQIKNGNNDSAFAILANYFASVEKGKKNLDSLERMYQPKEKTDPEVKNISYQPETQQLPDELAIGKVADCTTAYFKADRPFYIIEKTEDAFTLVPMPAGNSSRYFAWGGNIRISGRDREDVKIVKTVKK